MNKAPFFICPPRTRSSVLFQLMEFYANQKLGLSPVEGHIELFLEFSHNNLFTDLKTGETQIGELYPVIKQDELHVHFISPPVFKTGAQRNLYKLSVLQQAKTNRINYNIKGTVNITDTPDEILDFFSDRHIILTKRRDTELYVLSFLYAFTSKLFNARDFNYDRYMEKLNAGVTVSQHVIDNVDRLLDKTIKTYKLQQKLVDKGIQHTVTYYEDLNTEQKLFDKISEIYGTTEWQDYLPSHYRELIPIKVEKDYTKCILNYSDIIHTVRQKIKESGIDKL